MAYGPLLYESDVESTLTALKTFLDRSVVEIRGGGLQSGVVDADGVFEQSVHPSGG